MKRFLLAACLSTIGAMAVAEGSTMTDFRSAATDYLSTRRAMGYKLANQAPILDQFVTYLEDVGAEHVTISHALTWAKQPTDAALVWWAARLGTARRLSMASRRIHVCF